MEVSIVKRDAFAVCGFCVETTKAHNDEDISALYDHFFNSGIEQLLMSLSGAKKGYYGLSWYAQGHERYCYLLGMEVGHGNIAPENSILKEVPEAVYARACFSQTADIIKAWTEFFYNEIPKAGLEVDCQFNAYFEYYPGSAHGDYELWVPVVKADV